MRSQTSVEFMLLTALFLSLLMLSLSASQHIIDKGRVFMNHERRCMDALKVAEHVKYLCMLEMGSYITLDISGNIKGGGKYVESEGCKYPTWCNVMGDVHKGKVRLLRVPGGVVLMQRP